MTRADVIKLAHQAGIGGMLTDVVCTLEELNHFAGLVAAVEREECAKVCDLHSRLMWNADRKAQARTMATVIRARKDIP